MEYLRTMSNSPTPSIVVAGHICLDIIPAFPEHAGDANARIEPGHLYLMGPALCSTGGVVSNTGLALHRLGIETNLMGKIANDLFGHEVLNILNKLDTKLAARMIVAEDEYTLFCDNYNISLNLYDYFTFKGLATEDYLRGPFSTGGPLKGYSCVGDPTYELPCVNNFCILRYVDKGFFSDDTIVVVGTSLNQPANSVELSFLETLGKENDYCNELSDENEIGLGKCNNNKKLWRSEEHTSELQSH